MIPASSEPLMTRYFPKAAAWAANHCRPDASLRAAADLSGWNAPMLECEPGAPRRPRHFADRAKQSRRLCASPCREAPWQERKCRAIAIRRRTRQWRDDSGTYRLGAERQPSPQALPVVGERRTTAVCPSTCMLASTSGTALRLSVGTPCCLVSPPSSLPTRRQSGNSQRTGFSQSKSRRSAQDLGPLMGPKRPLNGLHIASSSRVNSAIYGW